MPNNPSSFISQNLKLPYIAPAQAQKHVTVNEAFRRLDAVVQLSVLDKDLGAPPASPSEGARYIIAAGATDDWTGVDANIAAYQDGAWAFITPLAGWVCYVVDEAKNYQFDGTNWVESGVNNGDNATFAQLGVGGATADATNKFSINTDAVLFNNNGAGIQAKLNKNAVADTASFLFQTGFSGRAEIGLTGNDDFSFKVSPDGSTFYDSFVLDKDNGMASFYSGLETVVDVGSSNVINFKKGTSVKGYFGLASATNDHMYCEALGDARVLYNFSIGTGSSIYWGVKNHVIKFDDTGFYPTTSTSNGTAAKPWADMFSVNPLTVTSDERAKKDIVNFSSMKPALFAQYKKFADAVELVSFKWTDGKRTHYGAVAQQVRQAVIDAGLSPSDTAFFVHTEVYEDIPVLDKNGEQVLEVRGGTDLQKTLKTTRVKKLNPDGTPYLKLGLRAQELLVVLFAVERRARLNIERRLERQTRPYTLASLPLARAMTGAMIYVSDESGGAVMAFSDGTDWRRVTDRAIIA